MNKMQIFNYNSNEVRAIQRDGEPWFVLKDVCSILGLGTPSKVADRLDDDEKGMSQIHTLGGNQEMAIINESGLYNVILRSDKPEAKPFRKWVTSEVLPSIRKSGGYIQGQAELTAEELMAKALMVAQRTLAEREARISALTVENQIMAPKADYFDQLCDRGTLTNFRDTAKELGAPPRAFVQFLIDRKYIYRDKKGKLMPYENRNDGLFEVKESLNEKTKWSGTQTLITPKGRDLFRQLYIAVGAGESISTTA